MVGIMVLEEEEQISQPCCTYLVASSFEQVFTFTTSHQLSEKSLPTNNLGCVLA